MARTLRQVSNLLNMGLTGAILAVVLSACATTQSTSVATCLDDSSACISKRQSTLAAMLADPQRAWVSATPSPKVYATGVRLFAWRKSKSDLSCPELRSGIAETAAARTTLSQRIPGASQTRLGQIIALSDDVNGELRKSAKRKRCPSA